MDLSDFGVLAQNWDVGPNVKKKINSILNSDKEEVCTCSDCSASSGVIPFTQTILESFGVVTGVLLNTWKHQRADVNTIFENPL